MRAQIAAFVEGGADMVTAYTLNTINEAIGVARAARAQRIPAAISFTVETNGRLVNGEVVARRRSKPWIARPTVRRNIF